MLTGRAARFDTLRQGGGISGFAMRSESEFDAFGAGHASTSISAGARHGDGARSAPARNETVVAVIGDGALTGGLAYEAINNAGLLKTQLHRRSSTTTRCRSRRTSARSPRTWRRCARSRCSPSAREHAKDVLDHVPFGDTRAQGALDGRDRRRCGSLSHEHKAAVIFEEMGFRYIGPIDGHDLRHADRRDLERAQDRRPGAAARAHRQRQGLRDRRGRQRARSTASGPGVTTPTKAGSRRRRRGRRSRRRSPTR